ncbi:MAG: archease [Candidatus Kerfeldbacteria bacterium]
MKKFEFIGHTADIRMKVAGATQEELFASAFEGLSELLSKSFCKDSSAERKDAEAVEVGIAIDSPDMTALLVDFLSEVLLNSHEQKAVFCTVDFSSITETALTATLKGSSIDGFDDDVKAVTYHEADIVKNADGEYETIIVFDI